MNIVGWIAFGVVGGIGWATFVSAAYSDALLLALLGVTSLIFRVVMRELSLNVPIAFFVAAGALMLWMQSVHTYSIRTAQLDSWYDISVRAEGVVTADVERRGMREVLLIEVSEIEDVPLKKSVAVRIFVPRGADILYGDTIVVSGVLTKPKPFLGENGAVPYDLISRAQGMHATIMNADIVSQRHDELFSLWRVLYSFKHAYRDNLEAVVDEPYAGLANGITIGEKRALPESLSEQFRLAGLSHIVVLSGYNIALVVSFLLFIFLWAPFRVRYVCAAVGALLFVMMTGFEAPAVRALGMALVVLLGRVLYRAVDPMTLLAAVAVCMVLWNPLILFDDVSFQLSVLATLGLVLFSSHDTYASTWIGVSPHGFFVSYVRPTIATLALVAPYILFQFGEISFVSVVSNVLVVPLIPIVMWGSACTALCAVLYMPLGMIAGSVLEYVLGIIIGVAAYFGNMSWAILSIPVTWWMLLGYYCVVWVFYSSLSENSEVMRDRESGV